MTPLLEIKDVAAILKVSPRTVYRLIEEGLVCYDIAGKKFKEQDVLDFIESKRQITPEEFAVKYIYDRKRIA